MTHTCFLYTVENINKTIRKLFNKKNNNGVTMKKLALALLLQSSVVSLVAAGNGSRSSSAETVQSEEQPLVVIGRSTSQLRLKISSPDVLRRVESPTLRARAEKRATTALGTRGEHQRRASEAALSRIFQDEYAKGTTAEDFDTRRNALATLKMNIRGANTEENRELYDDLSEKVVESITGEVQLDELAGDSRRELLAVYHLLAPTTQQNLVVRNVIRLCESDDQVYSLLKQSKHLPINAQWQLLRGAVYLIGDAACGDRKTYPVLKAYEQVVQYLAGPEEENLSSGDEDAVPSLERLDISPSNNMALLMLLQKIKDEHDKETAIAAEASLAKKHWEVVCGSTAFVDREERPLKSPRTASSGQYPYWADFPGVGFVPVMKD